MTDPHVLADDLLPTPFTADEIRVGCPVGRTIRLLVEPPGAPSYERVNRFADCDDEGATIESWRLAPDGRPVEVTSERSTWLDLQRHAAFPAATTTVEEGLVELPFGPYPALVYVLESGARFVFAPALPGMPVRFEIPSPAGLHVTTMVSDERPG